MYKPANHWLHAKQKLRGSLSNRTSFLMKADLHASLFLSLLHVMADVLIRIKCNR